MSDPNLQIAGLTKRYAPHLDPAIENLHMEVEEGHLVALLGPSGCGKTTTLRIVAGLMDPTAGEILVDGKSITNTPVNKRGMGMVFQSYALFPHMNVEQNVSFGLEMRKTPKEERARRIAEALEMVQLGHLAKRNVKALSGGQQQRIALARALVVEPTLLLLDEPLSNLDAKLRQTMRTEIRSIQQRTRATTLFVTHDQDEALDMADRIAVMNGGVIEQFGSPTDVYERPRTKFVVNFIGQANIMGCTVDREVGPGTNGEREYQITVDGLGTFGALGEAGAVGTRRDVVVRPHRLDVLYGDRIDPSRSSGTITHVSYTGDAVSFWLKWGDMELEAQQMTRHDALPQIGDPAQISWLPQNAYLLPDISEAEVIS